MANGITNLSDLNLVAPQGGSDLGKPGKTLGGPSELRKALESVPKITRGSTLRQTLGTPRGALATALGAITAGVLGGKAGLVGFASGVGEQIEGIHQEQLEQRAGSLKAIAAEFDAQEKISQGVRTLLGQQPELFEGVDPTLLGEIVAPGMGLQLSPSAMLADARRSEDNKRMASLIIPLMKEAQGPDAKRALARVAFGALFKPDELATMPASVLDQFWQQDGEFTDEQLVSNFGMTGVEAAAARQRGEPLPYHILELLPPDAGKSTEFQEIKSLLDKAQAHVDQEALAGKFITLKDAVDVALSQAEREILKDKVPTLYPGLTEREVISQYMNVVGMVKIMAAANAGLFRKEGFDESVSAFLDKGFQDASRLNRFNSDAAFADVVKKFQRQLEASDLDGKLSLQELTARARSLAEQQFKAEGRAAEIPKGGK